MCFHAFPVLLFLEYLTAWVAIIFETHTDIGQDPPLLNFMFHFQLESP